MLFNLRRRTDVLHLLTLMVLLSLPALVSYNSITQLEAIQAKGVLRVATRNTPSAYFIDKGEPAGFEYELSKAFADHLGVSLELIIPTTIEGLFNSIRDRDAHLVAAGVNISAEREQQFQFSTPYSQSISTVIYRVRQGVPPPRQLEDLLGKRVLVLQNSIQAEQLAKLKAAHPTLDWIETNTLTSTDILDKVFNEEVDYAIVDSVVYDAQNSFYPALNKGFTLGESQPIAWILTLNQDGSLKQAVNGFLALESTQQLIQRLQQKYFAKRNPLNFFDTVTFKKDMRQRLPCLEQYFHMAEQETGIDWMLLAAIAYQESHWQADAVSPTGVKGIMMLTQAAANEIGIEDRSDPVQSIMGGADYLISIKKKIPERIKDPDHTWFALAGYNIGFGHLEDARILAQRSGADPDNWEAVRTFLPLLSKESYFSTLKYGYARGQEPVQYVSNIQKYIKLLVWEKQIMQIRRARQAAREKANARKQHPLPSSRTLNSLPAQL